jgi:hypothetical protein
VPDSHDPSYGTLLIAIYDELEPVVSLVVTSMPLAELSAQNTYDHIKTWAEEWAKSKAAHFVVAFDQKDRP